MENPKDADGGLAAEIISVAGIVQRVGFRRYVEKVAWKFGIVGFVQNLQDGRVRIFAQGTREKLVSFVEKIKSAPAPIFVKSVERKPSTVRPRVTQFQVKAGPLVAEMMEGLGAMESQFADYRQEFRDFRGEFRDYREEFRGFTKQTNDNFALLNDKYGEISGKITQILERSSESRAGLDERPPKQ